MSSEPVISVRQVSKAYTIYDRPEDRLKQMLWLGRRKFYREFWALRDVDLEVFKGETLGIIGRNGSGKSTLLQLICGTLYPTWGQIEVRGRVAALLELGAGFNPDFIGMENLVLNASILGLTEGQIGDRVESIAAFADIGEFLYQPVKTYSSGMYARLAFAVAVHVDPEVLIVDEIMAVGDAAFQRKCVQKFYEIKERGATILFVSHDAYQVKNLCDRAIYLVNGHSTAIGPSHEVVDRYTFDLEAAGQAEENQEEAATTGEAASESGDLFTITSVTLEDVHYQATDVVQSGGTAQLRINYRANTREIPEKVTFVFNLYRHDNFYISGTTTLMEGLPPFPAYEEGEIVVQFPRFPLNAGKYVWRVAINDEGGLHVHAQANPVCPFRVVDNFKAVGLLDLPHEWSTRPISAREAKKAV